MDCDVGRDVGAVVQELDGQAIGRPIDGGRRHQRPLHLGTGGRSSGMEDPGP